MMGREKKVRKIKKKLVLVPATQAIEEEREFKRTQYNASEEITVRKPREKKAPKLQAEEAAEEVEANACHSNNDYSKECNQFLLNKELAEKNYLAQHESEREFDYLYPNLNDAEFNVKIAEKREFNDTKYDGTLHEDIKEYADFLAKADFELSPHQAFVKNFMSAETPYNSLFLYHGLGTGKTCSAIGVCEEMRDYMKAIGSTKRIMIIASENVQDNFRQQLFDERK